MSASTPGRFKLVRAGQISLSPPIGWRASSMSQSHQLRRACFAVSVLAVAAAFTTAPAHPETMEQRYTKPVKVVAPTMIEVPVAGDAPALFPIYVSEDWSRPMPDLRRAVLVFHGLTRNADAYFEGASRPARRRGRRVPAY